MEDQEKRLLTNAMSNAIRFAVIASLDGVPLREQQHDDFARSSVRVTKLEDATEHVHPAPGSTPDYDGRGWSFLVFIDEDTDREREYMVVVEDITVDEGTQA